MACGFTKRKLHGVREHTTPIIQVMPRADFRYCIAPRRGIDIPFIEHFDKKDKKWHDLLWTSGTGVIDPIYLSSSYIGSLLNFHGGFFTCGPENVGTSAEGFPMHGSYSCTPAENINTVRHKGILSVNGTVRVVYPLTGPQFSISRQIVSRLGQSSLTILDRITNLSRFPSILMWKYHPCFIASEKTFFWGPTSSILARDEASNYLINKWSSLNIASTQIPECVYTIQLQKIAERNIRVGLIQGDRSWGAILTYDRHELNCLNLWKNASEGIVGIEPGNCNVMGLTWEKEKGTPCLIQAGESRTFKLQIDFVFTEAEVNSLIDKEVSDCSDPIQIIPWAEE